jgi:adenylate cyclase
MPVIGDGAGPVVLLVVAGVALGAVAVLAVLLVRARRQVDALRRQLERPAHAGPRSSAGMAMKAVVETAARVREQGLLSGLLMSSLDDLSRWMTDQRTEIAQVAAPDGTVTIFFSDIEDSTALNEQLGDARWIRILDAHDALVRRLVEKGHGHVVKSQGDGFMVVFRHPADAAHAAIAIQRSLEQRPGRRLRRTPIKVRIGMHVGEAVAREGDYFGRNVALAARIAAQAHGGEILVSDELRAALGEQDGLALVPRGDVALKGVADRQTLWELRPAPRVGHPGASGPS